MTGLAAIIMAEPDYFLSVYPCNLDNHLDLDVIDLCRKSDKSFFFKLITFTYHTGWSLIIFSCN
jgi:hypothetical protein